MDITVAMTVITITNVRAIVMMMMMMAAAVVLVMNVAMTKQ